MDKQILFDIRGAEAHLKTAFRWAYDGQEEYTAAHIEGARDILDKALNRLRKLDDEEKAPS